MAPRDLDQMLQHLEANAENELAFLADTGAEYFSTAQLIRLKGQWQAKHALFRQLNFVLIRIVAFSPVSLILWMGAMALNFRLLGLLFLLFFPFSFLLFFGGQLFIRFAFKGNGHHEQVGEMIDRELEKRRLNRKNAR